MKAVLGLEDGNFFVGEGFGAEGTSTGELVFTTQMTGYMEALTDPSYAGQLLMFTYPLIGNYGVDFQNFQNPLVHARGCITREVCSYPKHTPSLISFFEEQGLQGISGIDTRMLTIRTRLHGTLKSALIVGDDDGEQAVALARGMPDISAMDLIEKVTCKAPYRVQGRGKRIAILDLGVKKNIVVSLRRRDADVYIFPYSATKEEIDACRPQALFISNGPGDPKRATAAIETVRSYIGELPIYGICMGNQILALALGGETYKLKFGHRGSNQPVRGPDGPVSITTQNHGYVVDAESLPEGSSVTYRNVNDNTLEGFADPYLNIFCVQFHPEAHGGPQDLEKSIFDKIYRSIPDA
ncbi:carbamoyl-phosphate synthase small subunit [Methanocalculus alkaliphilus]|uniref:glutamine-hydrolyzing carbamoyl-phosphate synthase small subunit n=1 Tax=Methanocalculus alkaliphilus TaxID=768730 RepID=UPI00209F77F4|nr:glutamine-hydrolyzing carbamoyl-phosphate synthase small subunit [Methanocalculus alkaliphilus]MCP1714583.1 carbamoyl-phosphate synthase small subunit [Methanocalculus alkaliphilus]